MYPRTYYEEEIVKAQIVWNQGSAKYELVANGKVLVRSKSDGYLFYLVKQQKHTAILKANVTEAELVKTGITIYDRAGDEVINSNPSFNIDERFEFMEELLTMVINGSAKSMLISGEGGIGKSYTVLEALKKSGKVDCLSVMSSIDDTLKPIEVEDDEKTIEEKAIAEMEKERGDYLIIKGHSSAKSLYRLLYENRNRILVFDDCDSALKDGTSLDLLKAALDSYEERWVSWRVDRDMDIPSCFKFNGSIIFITNRPLSTIDEAVRTRCFKVDLSMTKQQRIERMRSVLHQVLPEIEMAYKEDALQLLMDNLHLTNDINFRTLMNLTLIRSSAAEEKWKNLAIYALTEQ